MTDQQHPITPSPELAEKWYDEIDNLSTSWMQQLATRAAQWGADQELEACCEWAKQFNYDDHYYQDKLHNARRLKAPTLKEQGLESLNEVIKCLKVLVPGAPVDGIHIENIRRALEALPE
jgi:hypothetical protein